MPGAMCGPGKVPKENKPFSKYLLFWIEHLFGLFDFDSDIQTEKIDNLLNNINLDLIKDKFPNESLSKEGMDVSYWFYQQEKPLDDWEWVILFMFYGELKPIMDYTDDLSKILYFIYHETELLCEHHVRITLDKFECPYCGGDLDLTLYHISDDNIIEHPVCTDTDVMNGNINLSLRVSSDGINNALDSILWGQEDHTGYGFDVEID